MIESFDKQENGQKRIDWRGVSRVNVTLLRKSDYGNTPSKNRINVFEYLAFV